MTEDIIKENEDLIERIVHGPEIEERRELIYELIEGVPLVIMKKIEQRKSEIENLIKTKNSDITNVEFETKHKDLLYWDELDKTRIIKTISLKQTPEIIRETILNNISEIVSIIIRRIQ